MNQSNTLLSIQPRDEAQSVHEWVYQALSDSILAGNFVPGVSVTLRGIAHAFDVSPMPVREATRRLVAEGALEVLTNRRVSVAKMTHRRLTELHHARLQLEPELAVIAMPHIRKSDIKVLHRFDQELNQSLRSGDVDTYIRCNRRFHFGIYERADSPVLLPLVNSLWLQFAPYMRIVFGRVGTDYLQDYHAAALTALSNGDERSFRRAIKSDIREGMELLAEQFQREQVIALKNT